MIILVWQQVYSNLIQDNVNNFWGIGDLIRGTIATFQLSKKYNIELCVDTSNHPVGHYLKNNKTKYSNILSDKNIIFLTNNPNELENYILNNINNTIFIGTNSFCNTPLSLDDKEFIKYILEPNNDIKNIIQKEIELLPKNFTIQHYRFGDSELVRNIKNNFLFDNILDIVKNNFLETDILMTDSNSFKNYIKNNFNIKILNSESVHLGYEKDINKIKSTMIDFYIIMNSKNIKTYKINSGFVYWISKIYDIPLQII